MARIRIVEETIAEKYKEQKIRCPTHLCTGQEAVSAAVGMALRKDDLAVSTHRAHGHYLGKGGSLPKMIAEIYGKATGCSKGKGGSMHLIDQSVGFMGSTAIVGNSMPIGAGLGLSIKLNKSDQVSCIFIGDATIEEGVFGETVNFCAQRKLPVLFVCENNLYSVYSSLAVRQPKGRSIVKMVEAMGIPSSAGDGNNVASVYKTTQETVSDIRVNGGPRFLEFKTYRWREHCGPNFDNNIGYRTEKEFQAWKEKDPIVRAKKELLDNKLITEREINQINKTIEKEVKEAFKFADKSPFPKPKDAFKDIYAEEIN